MYIYVHLYMNLRVHRHTFLCMCAYMLDLFGTYLDLQSTYISAQFNIENWLIQPWGLAKQGREDQKHAGMLHIPAAIPIGLTNLRLSWCTPLLLKII